MGFEQKQLKLVKLSDPISKKQLRFLRDLYCVSRDEEIAQANLPAKQLKTFLHQQFELQQKHYDKHYQQADKFIVRYQDKDIGRIYWRIDKELNSLHLIDITLLREFRNQGFGDYLMRKFISKAQELTMDMTLYVDPLKKAFKWYQTLGFETESKLQNHCLMRKIL